MAGCSSKNPPLQTVEKVELNKYLGKWYEIAKFDHYFERGCSKANATYSLNPDSTIKVVNSCTKDGKYNEAIGKAYATDNTNSKLKVSFFWPFYGNYWVLDLGKEYEYAVIGEPSRKYFWILSRTATIDFKLKNKIILQMKSWGYDSKRLIWVEQ
jgi:apolipoprotein D and lipocalin family protein